jgi:serine phosphatase RsbU (regulator of sigma subunit)
MTANLDAFRSAYMRAFRSYLGGGGETGLESAYELGREAVTGELSLLELARIHHDVLADSLARAPADELARIAGAGTDFFLESLSTFEMTQRGFREAQETARLEQRHAAQLRGLADAALALNSTMREDEMLEVLGERACAIVGADHSTIHVASEAGDGAAEPLRGDDRLAAPLIARDGRPRGVIALSGKRGGEFTEEDESILVQLAHMASVAIENARLYERERGIAETLQRNLLPERLPKVPGVMTCAEYRAGGAGVNVGGDWYEVIPLPDGCVALAIGDVVGRGVPAAAMMGHVRMALRAYALDVEEPALVAERMARFARTLEREQMSTCVYGVLDPRLGEVRCSNAGHPPPLLVRGDGSASFLVGEPGLPFGVSGKKTEYPELRATLDPGSTLLLYTDGLIEKRGESIDVGLERLRGAVAQASAAPEALCRRLVDSLIDGTPEDDVALLAVRWLGVDGRAPR